MTVTRRGHTVVCSFFRVGVRHNTEISGGSKSHSPANSSAEKCQDINNEGGVGCSKADLSV